MPRTPKKKKSKSSGSGGGGLKEEQEPPQQKSHVALQDDEEENSTDSVELAAREAAADKDDQLFDQDSLMFEEVDDVELPADDDDGYEVTGTGRGAEGNVLSGFPVSSPDTLFDETDSTLNTPYGSPMSAISSFSSIQKWTGEVKKMLLDDQQQSENRTKGWVFPPEVLPSLSSAGRSEGFADVEGSFPDSDFDVMPTTEELAEKYSNELIEKEKSILQKDAKIIELERACRDIKDNLEDCQKELKQKTEAATSGVEKLKLTLEEKDKCIMETSEKLRKVTESYNSSEKRWIEQQKYLEKQIEKLKSEMEAKSSLGEELERLTEESKREKLTLEDRLEKAKEETVQLKKHFSEEMASLEEELRSLKDEKLQLEEQLQEEIQMLEDKLMLSEQACETAISEKETIKLELESQEERNKTLISDLDVLKEKREEIILQQKTEKQSMEELINLLKEEKNSLEKTSATEKYELELQVQTLREQLERQQQDQTTDELVASLNQKKEILREELAQEKYELELQLQTYKEELQQAKLKADDTDSRAPVNFFTQETNVVPQDDWLETKKSMENRIAELELEKGNLLLQLVDVDDEQQVSESERIAAAKVEEIHNQVQKQLELEVEATKQALSESELKIDSLEKELEESKLRDGERIESAMNTIAWEEKVETLQKQNESLADELLMSRKSADELSCRYEELEKKCEELESGRPPIEGMVEIDKCDGWSDDTPQMPEADEGFTEDPQIAELKEALEGKEREISEMRLRQQTLENELADRGEIMVRYETMLSEVSAEKSAGIQKLDECMKEIERLQKELQEKVVEQEKIEAVKMPTLSTAPAPSDGWGDDDPPVLLDEGFNDDTQQLTELKLELYMKSEELTATTAKCKTMEDKLKKALKALKQKNDKLAELKKRIDDDPMSASTVAMMEASAVPVQEPIITKSVAYECGELEKLKRECQEKEYKIYELEAAVKSLQEYQSPPPLYSVSAPAVLDIQEDSLQEQQYEREIAALVQQRDYEIGNLKNELSQLASTLNSKNDEIEQLMKACGDMEKSVDEKVELLNDCVNKKDEEVRQAISQYEDFLKDATLNVSQLTKELEEKIREINMLHGQVQEAQESLLETQNEFESYKQDSQNLHNALYAKDQELEGGRQLEDQLRQELLRLQTSVNELSNNQALVSEALDRADAEKNQLREESVCIQNEYGNKNRELQVQISQLIDQLNERESAISVMETRLKESDEQSDNMVLEIRAQLEQKIKALEQIEQTLFVKTEECLRLEDKMKDSEEKYRLDLDAKLRQLEEQHKTAFDNFALLNSEDLDRTCEQLARRNTEVAEIQEQFRQLQERSTQLEQEYNVKCSEIMQKDQSLLEVDSLRTNIQNLEGTIASYTHALNNNTAELNQKTAEVTNLQSICSQYEEKLYNSTMSLDEAQRSLQEKQASLAQCQHDLSNYYNELQNSKLEIEELRKAGADYQVTVERLNSEIRESKTEAARYSTEVQTMGNQLSRQQEVESSLNKYLEDLNAATDELGKKNSEMRELEKIIQTQETQIQSLQASLESVRNEIASKDILISEKEEYISKLEAEAWEMTTLRERESHDNKQAAELLAELEEKSREISDLRFELDEGILQEKSLKKNLEEKDREMQALRSEISNKNGESAQLQEQIQELLARPSLSPEDESIAQMLQYAKEENQMMERKIDLLQNKLAEVESSEVKVFEDFSRLKILRTELEMDNLRMSGELEQFRGFHDGDNDPKYRAMENQLVLMSKTLDDRDKLCRDLMKNISELQETHDALQVQVNDLQVVALPSQYSEGSLEAVALEMDRDIFSLKIDIDRERKIRELYEGLLFLATSKKQFDSGANKSGGWFGLGDLFSSSTSSSPPPRQRPTSPPRSTFNASMAPPFTPQAGAGPPSLPFTSTPSRPVTPYRPATPVSPAGAFQPAMFDTPGGQGQPQFVPPMPSPPQFSLQQDPQPNTPIPSPSNSNTGSSPLNTA